MLSSKIEQLITVLENQELDVSTNTDVVNLFCENSKLNHFVDFQSQFFIVNFTICYNFYTF